LRHYPFLSQLFWSQFIFRRHPFFSNFEPSQIWEAATTTTFLQFASNTVAWRLDLVQKVFILFFQESSTISSETIDGILQ
jgi:hypothetical protein